RLLAARGQEDHRDLREFADVVEDLKAALFRNHQVEQHQVGLLGVELADRFLAVGGLNRVVVLQAKVDLQPLPQPRFVLNDQNLGHVVLRMSHTTKTSVDGYGWRQKACGTCASRGTAC